MRVEIITSLAGQNFEIAYPNRKSTGRLIIIVHGGGLLFNSITGNPYDSAYAFSTRVSELIEYLTARGYTVACPALYDFGITFPGYGDTFGNSQITTQLTSVVTAVKALPNVSQGKFGFIGFSSGTFGIANYIRANGNSGIAGVLTVDPACSQSFYRGTDASHSPVLPDPRGASYAACNLAWRIGGVNGLTNCDSSWTPAITSIYEPSVIMPSVTVPWGFWTHSNDPIAPPSEAHKLAILIPNGKGTEYDMGSTDTNANLGHNTLHLEPKDVLNFLETWSW